MISRPPATLLGRQGSQLRMLMLCALLTLMATAAGCAKKPWRQPIAEDRQALVLQVIDEMRQEETRRSGCIDSDVDLFFTSRMKNRAISGYLRLMQPTSIKFISSNPLGQPLIAFASNGSGMQFVNTFEQYFMDGDLAAFAELYEIPAIAYTSSWGKWLTGRLPEATAITAIRQDESNRGFWVSFAAKAESGSGKAADPVVEHLLIDLDNRLLLGRIFTDSKGGIEARISYSDWLRGGPEQLSRQPGRITITELDYGAEIVVKFSALEPMEYCSGKDFNLSRPAGYRHAPVPTDRNR